MSTNLDGLRVQHGALDQAAADRRGAAAFEI